MATSEDMDLQITPPTPNTNADENGDTRLISEAGISKSQGIAAHNQATDGWQLVLSRRQREAAKQNDRDKASNNKNKITGQPSAGGAKGDGHNGETGTGRRNMRPTKWKPLPPLPKNDIKIILKPHKGLMLKEYLRTEIPQAIIRATGTIIIGNEPNQRKIPGEDFILRIREGTNIIIVSTPSLEVADVIRRITCIELRGKRHPFNVYVADPEDSYKGVVHGFPAHTESADLEQHLRVRTQGVSIARARMLGNSNDRSPHLLGRHAPQMRVLHGSRDAVYGVYRPTIQTCLECMQEGHRSDVCPNPKNICRGCGLENPPAQGHECEVKCAVCWAAGHETRRCPNKLIAAKRGKTTRQSRSRERSGRNTTKAPGRWFESTDEEDLYRRRSRSRSPHGSRAMSNTPSRDPSSSRASQRSNSPLPKKQQWNCRSFSRKAAVLHQFIKNSEIAPDVICLQEVGAKPAKLQGYYTLSDPQNSKVATLPNGLGLAGNQSNRQTEAHG
ncbi:hypothetical protein HPB49_005388 [Dermacentor silvarum]|uniref:Uncharacterized protein n=1 Tax=Dermacentor silvarum TaxID=543639 RepID=A0ACB8CVD3_DERSI|nr:hypothetical protein HPB49_005388 [Dermacentor silvarum]